MNATLTIVMCFAAIPEVCKLKELRVDAHVCFYGGHNVAVPALPDGYVPRPARCVSQMGRQRQGA
jgi:hypothetical protein